MMRIANKSLSLRSKVTAFVCAIVCALALGGGAATLSSSPAYADEQASGYSYKVLIYAGNGQSTSGPVIDYGDQPYNSSIRITNDFLSKKFTPSDSRYYVKGLRVVGHEELLDLTKPIMVDEDKQFVVAYGLKKDQVEYKVNYVDTNGNQIAESQTFWGNVGDKPVVAYQYIAGYQPVNAQNITGTVKPLPEQTEFTFEYAPVGATSSAQGSDGSSSAGGSGDNATIGEDATDGATAEDAGNAVSEGEDAGSNGVSDEPAELLDIDDEDNPLASANAEDANGFGLGTVLPWVLGVCIAAALIAFIVLMVMKSRQKGQDA